MEPMHGVIYQQASKFESSNTTCALVTTPTHARMRTLLDTSVISLIVSTSRGCKALNARGSVTNVLTQDAMTRGPAIDFPTIIMAAHSKAWFDSDDGDGYTMLKAVFESTLRFAHLKSLKTAMFVHFATARGGAMGMNMISKGTEDGEALEAMQNEYPEMVVLVLLGNYCTNEKPATINWIKSRGKSVVADLGCHPRQNREEHAEV